MINFQVDQDPQEKLVFHVVPLDRASLAAALLRNMVGHMQAGASEQGSLSDAKAEIAREIGDAFRATDACIWLTKCRPGEVSVSGGFLRLPGSLPIPNITVTFAGPALAAKFKISFGGTVISPEGAPD